MGLSFQRRRETFVCVHCQETVIGDGYTNHCPRCLWSLHVDQQPGDRAEACGGPMEPIKVELRHDEFVITHRCQVCHHEKRNRAARDDNREEMIRITADVARRFMNRTVGPSAPNQPQQ